MKILILLLLTKLKIFSDAESALGTISCSTPDCGNKELAMKDIKFNIGFELGEIRSKSNTACDTVIPASQQPPIHPCNVTFKAIHNANQLLTKLALKSNEMDLLRGDLIHCKIYHDRIPVTPSGLNLHVYTIAGRNPIYMSAPRSQCFSFKIKAKNDAKIILKNTIHIQDRIEIVLGAHNNTDITYKVMRSQCEHAINNPPYPILKAYDFIDYWICWRSGKVILGKGDQVIIDENENIDVKDPIEYIALETANLAAGVWIVMESNCPKCYQEVPIGYYTAVSCVKVEDTCQTKQSTYNTTKSSKESPKESTEESLEESSQTGNPYNLTIVSKRLYELLHANQMDFNRQKSAGTLSIRSMEKSLEDINNLHQEVQEIERKILKCSQTDNFCKEMRLDNSLKKFENLYLDYLSDLQREINYSKHWSTVRPGSKHSRINEPEIKCHQYAHMEFESCVCNLGWAGDGNRCQRDTDFDGFPDIRIPECFHHLCRADNCPSFPNSRQNDNNSNGIGDVCDPDIDDDGKQNEDDNCPYVANADQKDFDKDNIGDACDNCKYLKNEDQLNTDNKFDGDECDSDIDDDGIKNGEDNCQLFFNPLQYDSDKDGVGDDCDNCPTVSNQNQADKNENLIGDACEIDLDDDDFDGVPNERDNCKDVPNASQLDADNDGQGDLCDDDIDNDTIKNYKDNCVHIPNMNQTDYNGNNIGDICENDFDNDKVPNNQDICPFNPFITHVHFNKFQTVSLNPKDREDVEPKWIYNSGENTFTQTKNSKPGLLIGHDVFESVEYNGTFYVNTDSDNDYIGFVFSYLNNRKFYIVMWKKESHINHKIGLQIKFIDSLTGPGNELRDALWHHKSTKGQVKILWEDPKIIGWKPKTAYRWILRHIVDKSESTIDLSIYQGDKLIIKSNSIPNNGIYGGRLGLFTFSQGNVVWANLEYRCLP